MNARRVLAVVGGGALLALGAPSGAQEKPDPVKERLEKSPRHHEWVNIETKGARKVRAFVAFPEVAKPVPAVIVIHENRGLTDWIRSVADRLAEAGYVAVAPDLLSGTGPDGGGTESFESADAARDGIYRLPPEQVLADLDATSKYAKKLEATNEKVAVAGFCWGGGQAFRYAAGGAGIVASFVFYGQAPEKEELGKVSVPVYGFYGGNDFRITGKVPEVAAAMERLGKKFEPVTYEGAGHGFLRAGEDPDASPANRDAREKAWARWKELLGKL